MVSLPTTKSKAKQNLGDYNLLIYGREKIGKTSLAAQFPNAVFLMFEPGGKALDIYQVEVLSWQELKVLLTELKTDTKFDTIVIDTVDIMYRMCLEWVQKYELAGKHPADEGYGKGWDRLKSEFQKRVATICKLGKGVIFISHEKESEEEKHDGTKIDTIQPSMSGTARGIVEPMVDLVGYYFHGDEDDRCLQIEGSREIVAGCRMKEAGFFPDCDVIDMGSSSKEAFKNFCSAMALTKGKRKK